MALDALKHELPRVAYFCMEYGLHEELRTYAGGLGILAGDYLKSAKDLDLPVVGIGMMWHNGYTTQLIGEDGKLHDTFPEQATDMLKDTGKTVSVRIRNRDVTVKIWLVDVYDNAPLYLLDTTLPINEDKWINNQLYGGDSDERIAQEIVLGIGGVRALRSLGIEVDIYHFNEGHAVFAGLELIRETMSHGSSFELAWEATRKRITFTTHTPVPAGNETHDLTRLCYWGACCGLDTEQMRRIGGSPFSMTVAGLRLSALANGVSQLHGQTAQRMWHHVEGAAPIVAITNGVHQGTWQDGSISKAWDKSDGLWQVHQVLKAKMVDEIARMTGVNLSPESIIVGFARRAAPYKRHDLIFRRIDAIEQHLMSRRLQLVFAGRAHPNDHIGKEVIASLIAKTRRFPNSTVFLENYDIRVARLMSRGCDVWLNNPLRPMEASGTSGMKAAMNGLLNVSTLDGWWAESCRHGECGWRIGHGHEGPEQDERDPDYLYDILTKEVLPTYYDDRPHWVNMMKMSIDMSHWNYSTGRMLQEYYTRIYKPVYQALSEPSLSRR